MLLKAPAPCDKSKQKSMNASEKKGDESKVRRKQASREEAKEDENLVKRIIIEKMCHREKRRTTRKPSKV